MNRSRSVRDGKCLAWPLPADLSCARVARRLFRDSTADLEMAPEQVEDGIMMASELAANTLHASCAEGGDREVPSCPELWLYLRTTGFGGGGRELVCKIFDSSAGWRHGISPVPGKMRGCADGEGESGRGLQVVHELSGGHWGFHLTRARLGVARGKSVWFAQPVPEPASLSPAGQGPGVALFPRVRTSITALEAARELQSELEGRGFAGRLVRADDPAADMSVVSVSDGLAVWCRAGVAWLRIPGREGLRWPFGDLVEVAEQVVRVHEELGHDRPQPVAAEAGR
jgi:hypothetical protein